VNEYRVYVLGEDGHFISFRAFSCQDDSEAIVWAKQLVDAHPVELWSGGRFIVRLESIDNGGNGPAKARKPPIVSSGRDP
jgi:hypothetical protein